MRIQNAVNLFNVYIHTHENYKYYGINYIWEVDVCKYTESTHIQIVYWTHTHTGLIF